MAYLRWRRFIELTSLDRPWVGELFMRKRDKPIVAAPVEKWDREYREGVYDRLARSDQRHHHRLLAAMIADRWPNPRVLEIGAGEGVLFEAFRPHAPARYVGVDFSAPAIEQGLKRLTAERAAGQVDLLLGDGRTFRSDEAFDVIVFSECVEHLGEVEDLVAHYAPNLKPDGGVGLTMWLALKPLRLWHRLKRMGSVLDEATINTPWGGGWLIAVVRPVKAAVTALAMTLAGLATVVPVDAFAAPALDLPLSIDMARAAVDACAAKGAAVSVSVVDDKGNPLVVLRAPNSPKPPIAAPRKAATAVQFDAPGSVMEPRQKADPAFAALIAAEPERLNPHAGSVPLHIDGKLVGGLAVADTTHETADACAREALAKFADKVR
ncbi:heme-binding protein [Caulobacter soli]|uniref:heme-binding protein n=1 Tax=Caulobacter soli TaxID=2708539 RepID=UPI0013EE1173|nr:heme-binding protein [Caulobacter soli]